MVDKVIGVDIGTNAVRAAQVSLSGGSPRLLRFGQVALPPGAVREGEVADPALVAEALRRLWKEAGFSGRRCRVGMASARVIVRTVELPVLSDADTTSALGLQLPEFVPFAPESTVFDFQPLDTVETDEGPRRRLLLAAAHQEAVGPLVEAIGKAGLKLAAVDVLPAALARALAPVRPAGAGPAPSVAGGPTGQAADELADEPFDAGGGGPAAGPEVVGADPGAAPVDAIVSIGAGTTVVVIARGAVPLFSRTVTNVAGRQVTERIAASLSLSAEDAERHKRRVPEPEADEAVMAGPGGTPRATVNGGPAGPSAGGPAELAVLEPSPSDAAAVAVAVGAYASELVAEIADSLTYYGGQPGALTVGRVLLAGGGSLLEGLPELLHQRLGIEVVAGDPFDGVVVGDIGFAPEDLPFLAPYLSGALGVALGGGRARAKRIDLLPAQAGRALPLRPLLAGGAVALLLVGTGALYLQRAGSISEERREMAAITATLAERRAAQEAGGADGEARTPASLREIFSVARTRDVDWVAVTGRLDAIGAPLGVVVASLEGGTSVTAPTAADPSGADGGVTAEDVPAEGPAAMGTVSLTGTAPGLEAVAGWVDAMEADDGFEAAWVNGVTASGTGETGGVQFSAEVSITTANLVARPLLEVLDR